MKFDLRRIAVGALIATALLATSSDQGGGPPPPGSYRSAGRAAVPQSAESVIGRWPDAPRALARIMLDKYGMPDSLAASQLSWSERPPWARVVVFRDPETAGRPNPLLESVAYGTVPLDRWRELAEIGRGAAYDPATGELSARTDGEATNILALNLADEVVRGRRTAWSARDFYDSTLNLALSGKSSPYMARLLFQPEAPPQGRRRGTGAP